MNKERKANRTRTQHDLSLSSHHYLIILAVLYPIDSQTISDNIRNEIFVD